MMPGARQASHIEAGCDTFAATEIASVEDVRVDQEEDEVEGKC